MKNLVGFILYSTFLVAASMSGAAAEQRDSCYCIEGTNKCLIVDDYVGIQYGDECPK